MQFPQSPPDRLLIATLFVACAHIAFLLIPSQKTQPASTTLSITLLADPPDEIQVPPPEPQREKEPQRVKEPQREKEPQRVKEPQRKQQPQPIQQPQLAKLPQSSELQEDEKAFRKQEIVTNALDHLNQPKYRTFSATDYQPEINIIVRRPSTAPNIFSLAQQSSSQNASGQSTDLIRSSNGDASCWQQRGIPGETQQWYRVPLALCGHLKGS